MIDFRYHIVSLISVFLALAVGIALGAGPLQGSIGEGLTGQVEQLRTEKEELRVALDAETSRTQAQADYLDAAAEELLADSLPRRVAVVALPGADGATVDGLLARLDQAGATVTARIEVAEAWTDPAKRSFRASLVGNLAGYLEEAPAGDATAGDVLGQSLAQALTSADPGDGARLSENAALLSEVLTSGELIRVVAEPTAPADAVLVVAAPTVPADATPQPTDEAVDAYVELVEALAGRGAALVAGPAASDADLVSAVRARDAADLVATVDGVVEVAGRLSVPRALAAALAGTVGHYGFAGSASSILPPRVSLPELQPAAETVG